MASFFLRQRDISIFDLTEISFCIPWEFISVWHDFFLENFIPNLVRTSGAPRGVPPNRKKMKERKKERKGKEDKKERKRKIEQESQNGEGATSSAKIDISAI